MTMGPKLGALAVVRRDNTVLMVQRGRDPGRGLWGFPGGHVELGETGLDAAARELAEETGIVAAPKDYLGCIDVIERQQEAIAWHYLLVAVECVWTTGEPVAADDAADAGWFTAAQIAALPTTANVDRVLGWIGLR